MAHLQTRLGIGIETVDGNVVGDTSHRGNSLPEKSIAFYKDVLGCTQLEGFDAPGQFATDIGLTDGLSFHVDVMTLGSDESATKIKLMSFPTSPGARVDQRFIHSSYGIRYQPAGGPQVVRSFNVVP